MIPTNHEALQWILTMTNGIRKLEQWRLRLSKLEVDVDYRDLIKKQASNVLSSLNTKGKSETPLQYEVQVFTLPQEIFICECKTE